MTLTQYVLDPGQCHKKWSPVPSTSRDPCTCIVWSCYLKRFWRRCIYKKILYMTFDLDLGVKITQNVAQYSLHHVTYAATKFEVAKSNGLVGDAFARKFIIWPLPLILGNQGPTKCSPVPSTSRDLCTCIVWSCNVERFGMRCIFKKTVYMTFDLGVKITQNVAQNSLHHVTYAATKFEVTTSKDLGGNKFTRKYIPWPWGQGHKKCCHVPSTPYDLCSCKFWSFYV